MSEEGVGVILPQEETAEKPPEPQSGSEYDLIIVGGGPAGLTAGVYAARKMLHTLLISKDIGGQILTTSEVENSGCRVFSSNVRYYLLKDFYIVIY